MKASSLATGPHQTSCGFRRRASVRGWQLRARELRFLFRQPRCARNGVRPVLKATSLSPSHCYLCPEESDVCPQHQVSGLRAVVPVGTWLGLNRSLYEQLRAHHCEPARTSPLHRQSCRLFGQDSARVSDSELSLHSRSTRTRASEHEPLASD